MKNIYVTGFIGSDRKNLAERLAEERGLTFLDLDEEIKERDGRSVMRIIMMMGEHEYRNKEYELLEELSHREDLVVCCGDGALFDEMCAELMEKGDIVIADADKSAEELWEAAKDDGSIPYAFMQFDPEDKKKETFFKLFEQRKDIYGKYI